MEEQKYFIPEIEDIRIGYEFELIDYASNNYNSDKSTCNWNSYVLEKKDIFSSYKEESFLETCICYLNSKHLRVPYLTKKQIENEGWKEIFNRHDGFGKYSYFQKGTTHITFQEKEHLIEIHNDEDYDEHKTWYNGKCRCINEFRAIMKFLEM